jgi:hypothetical protein
MTTYHDIGEVVVTHLSVDEWLALHEHRQQRRRGLQLLAQREHLLVEEDGEAEVEGRGYAGHKVEGGELACAVI